MITESHFRTKATIFVIYLILFISLGTYILFTKTDQLERDSKNQSEFYFLQRKS